MADLRTFRLPEASVDLVVSSYALHHLRDEDKRASAKLLLDLWQAAFGKEIPAFLCQALLLPR